MPIKIIPAILVLAACASGPGAPRWLSDPASHPDFPTTRYVTAAGSSATGTADAASAARAGVVRQIQSTITSAVRREVEVARRGEEMASERHFWQQVEERSAFEHGELVRLATASSGVWNDRHWAFAFVARSEADGVLAMDQAQVEQTLREAHRRGAAAAKKGDAGGLAQAWHEFKAQRPSWQALALQRRAVRGSPAPTEGVVARWQAELTEAAGRLRGRSEWRFVVEASDSVPDEARTAVADTLGAAWAKLGLRGGLSGSAEPCAGSWPDGVVGHELRVRPELELRRVSLGWRAELRLPAAGRACGGGGSFQSDLAGGRVFGIHPSDQRRALRVALRNLTPASVAQRLGPKVGELTPLP